MVRVRTALLALMGTLAFAGAATSASAADGRPAARAATPAVSLDDAARAANNQRRGLVLRQNSRWGLNLDQQQPVGREANWGDVDAGAFYRLSPSVRVGGSVALGERRADPARPSPEQRSQPRVRLETIFRF